MWVYQRVFCGSYFHFGLSQVPFHRWFGYYCPRTGALESETSVAWWLKWLKHQTWWYNTRIFGYMIYTQYMLSKCWQSHQKNTDFRRVGNQGGWCHASCSCCLLTAGSSWSWRMLGQPLERDVQIAKHDAPRSWKPESHSQGLFFGSKPLSIPWKVWNIQSQRRNAQYRSCVKGGTFEVQVPNVRVVVHWMGVPKLVRW